MEENSADEPQININNIDGSQETGKLRAEDVVNGQQADEKGFIGKAVETIQNFWGKPKEKNEDQMSLDDGKSAQGSDFEFQDGYDKPGYGPNLKQNHQMVDVLSDDLREHDLFLQDGIEGMSDLQQEEEQHYKMSLKKVSKVSMSRKITTRNKRY